jgi:hypothetical protein
MMISQHGYAAWRRCECDLPDRGAKNGDAITLKGVSTTSKNENGYGRLGSPARGGEQLGS